MGGWDDFTYCYLFVSLTCIAVSLDTILRYRNSTLTCHAQFYLGISCVAVVFTTIVSFAPFVRRVETLRNCQRHVGFTPSVTFETMKPFSVALVLVAVLVMSVDVSVSCDSVFHSLIQFSCFE